MMVVTRPAVQGVLKTRMLDDKEGRVLKKQMVSNCGAGEDTGRQQGDQTG